MMSGLAVGWTPCLVVLLRTKTRFNHLSPFAVRHPQRAVLNLARLLPEDGAKQLLLRRKLGLTLRRNLAHEDVARLHVCADTDDPILVEIEQALFPDVGNVARNLLRTELRIARLDFVLLDVNRRELIVPRHRL